MDRNLEQRHLIAEVHTVRACFAVAVSVHEGITCVHHHLVQPVFGQCVAGIGLVPLDRGALVLAQPLDDIAVGFTHGILEDRRGAEARAIGRQSRQADQRQAGQVAVHIFHHDPDLVANHRAIRGTVGFELLPADYGQQQRGARGPQHFGAHAVEFGIDQVPVHRLITHLGIVQRHLAVQPQTPGLGGVQRGHGRWRGGAGDQQGGREQGSEGIWAQHGLGTLAPSQHLDFGTQRLGQFRFRFQSQSRLVLLDRGVFFAQGH